MDQMRGQRGYTRLSKLFLVALVAAAVYFGAAFWPAASSHYRIKNGAKRLANRLLLKDGSNPDNHISKFLRAVGDREGLALTRPELNIENSADVVEIAVYVELPYEYPFLKEKRLWKTTIEVFAKRSRGF